MQVEDALLVQCWLTRGLPSPKPLKSAQVRRSSPALHLHSPRARQPQLLRRCAAWATHRRYHQACLSASGWSVSHRLLTIQPRYVCVCASMPCVQLLLATYITLWRLKSGFAVTRSLSEKSSGGNHHCRRASGAGELRRPCFGLPCAG